MIQVQNLVKQYGEHVAVNNLSFTIEKGKIYGFLGPNGAGKSTTMNIVTGYIGATSGSVLVNGFDITDEPEKAKKCIGFLPELPPIYTDMTVKEYLYFAAELKGIPKKDREAQINEIIKLVRIEDVFNRLTGNLSKGYKQRVGIAQALIGFPEVIILDEPTVGLDPQQVVEIRELIRDLGKDHTVIFSSHILSEVQEVCDKIIIINQGRLIANGTPAELEREFGASSLTLTVKSENPENIRAAIATLAGVTDVIIEEEKQKEVTLLAKLHRNVDIREKVFNLCIEKNTPILMMRSSEFSLENIFLQLTRERARIRRKVSNAQPQNGSTSANIKEDSK